MDIGRIGDFLTSASWKTTSVGIATVLISAGTLVKMLTTGAYDGNTLTLAITSLGTGFGMIFAKDKNVTGAPPTDKAK